MNRTQQRKDTPKISFTPLRLALEETVEVQEENLIHVQMFSDTVYTLQNLSSSLVPEILNG
jgi:hypothetical protein